MYAYDDGFYEGDYHYDDWSVYDVEDPEQNWEQYPTYLEDSRSRVAETEIGYGLSQPQVGPSLADLRAAPHGLSSPVPDGDGWAYRVTKVKHLQPQSAFESFDDIVAQVPPGTKWQDPNQPEVLSKHQGMASWIWPEQIWGRHARFVVPGRHGFVRELLAFDLSDVRQGSIGDCYLFGGLSVILQFPWMFNRCIGRRDEARGVYEFIFFSPDVGYGNEIRVCVDELIPTKRVQKRDGRGHTLKQLYVTSDDHGEFWPQLLEKAYAKVLGGYPELHKPGWCGESIGHLCNGAGGIYQQWCNVDVFRNPGALARKLKRLLENGFLLCVGFRQIGNRSVGESGELEGNQGLVSRHAYGILGLHTVAPAKGGDSQLTLIKLRNPWAKGKGEWQGSWAIGSPEWKQRPDVAKKVGYVASDKGVFYMSLGDFLHEAQGLMFARVDGLESQPQVATRLAVQKGSIKSKVSGKLTKIGLVAGVVLLAAIVIVAILMQL